MCRLAAYIGPEITIASLVTEPRHSIIHQSYHSKERSEPLNGDGFGISWFSERVDQAPVVFKEVSPAWNNPNLVDLARVTSSSCIFAHVRAATVGGHISRSNCHPFSKDDFVFMHNGTVHGFSKLRRKIQSKLSDEAFELIQGTTDTEHLFAIFHDQIRNISCPSTDEIADALAATIKFVEDLKGSLNIDEPSSMNLVVSNGKSMVACKYSTPGSKTNSLYYVSGLHYLCEEGAARLENCEKTKSSVLIASEPLTQDQEWKTVADNTMVVVNEGMDLETRPIQ